MLPRITQSQQLHILNYSEKATLNEVKRRKKELEIQAQSVENRIRQLRNEEGKLIKRIKQTEQLTSDVYKQKVAAQMKVANKYLQLKLVQQIIIYIISWKLNDFIVLQKQRKLQKNAIYFRSAQNNTKVLTEQSAGKERNTELYFKKTLERNQLKIVQQEFRQYKHNEVQNYRKLLKFEQFQFIEEQRKQHENQKLKAALRKQEQNLSEVLIREKLNEKKNKIKQELDKEKFKTIQENEERELHIKQLEIEELQIVQKLQATQQREKDVKGKLIAAIVNNNFRTHLLQVKMNFLTMKMYLTIPGYNLINLLKHFILQITHNLLLNNQMHKIMYFYNLYQKQEDSAQQCQNNNEQNQDQPNGGQQGTQTEE